MHAVNQVNMFKFLGVTWKQQMKIDCECISILLCNIKTKLCQFLLWKFHSFNEKTLLDGIEWS